MNAIPLTIKRQKTNKELQKVFEKKQKEAFRQFLQAHAKDPLFREYVLETYFQTTHLVSAMKQELL